MRGFLIVVAGLLMSAPLQAGPISKYRWENRLVLWQSDSAEFGARFLKTWDAVAPGCLERDILVLEIRTAEMREELGLGGRETVILLVGKDGGVKERWSEAVAPEKVFALIDAMPMRQREMRE